MLSLDNGTFGCDLFKRFDAKGLVFLIFKYLKLQINGGNIFSLIIFYILLTQKCIYFHLKIYFSQFSEKQKKSLRANILNIFLVREYSTYRVVTTSRLKAPGHLVVHDNLKTFTKYNERSAQNP